MNNERNDRQNQGQNRSSGQKNEGNFKNDPQRAAEAGRKGGEASKGRRS